MEHTLRQILGINDLRKDDIELILQTAESMKEISQRDIKKVPTLRGKTIVNLFYEPSTRTRTSFELAGKRLNADVINISAASSSIVKGESLIDTGKTLQALNPDIIVIRHQKSGAPHLLAKNVTASVVNAGDGIHEHPTQALLDLFSIREKLERLEGLKVCIVGDISHSRVARSDILCFKKMGMDVSVAGPATLIPTDIEKMGVRVFYDLEKAIENIDVIVCLRIQNERMGSGFFPSVKEYSEFYGINSGRLKKANKRLVVMHPGPINRGIEISPEVADGPFSIILDQVTNGLAVRMAILYILAGK
ncbi:MAG: aspartate carbamoyltransferase catalytic subunit [Thermodesulfobacteriota bacterium]|nr:aspartate carbamoyltransferase catalytic subunit [Thermodesulfobacteriota bacterium]